VEPHKNTVVGPMTLIETVLKTIAPAAVLASLFGARRPKRHKLPAWAAKRG